MRRALFLLLLLAACREREEAPPPSIIEDREPAKLEAWNERLAGYRAHAIDVATSSISGDTTFLLEKAPKGRPVLLSFWATYCPPCIAEMRSLQLLSDQGRTIVGVSLDATEPKRAAEVLAKQAVRYPNVVLDVESMKRMGAALEHGLPFAVVLDAKGRTVKLLSGELTGAHVEAALR